MSLHPPSEQAGISLLETLVALFLVALLTSSGTALVTQTLRASTAMEEKAASLQDVRRAHAILRDDFASMTRRAIQIDDQPGAARLFEGASTRPEIRLVTFVRNGWTNPGGHLLRSDLQRIEYRLAEGRLIRRSWSHIDTIPGTPYVDETLLSGLEALEIRFGREAIWLPEWIVDAESDLELPDKVELTFQFGRDDSLRLILLTGGLS